MLVVVSSSSPRGGVMGISPTTVAAGMISTLLAVQFLTPADPIGRCLLFLKQLRGHDSRLTCSTNVDEGIDSYNKLHNPSTSSVDNRNKHYKSLVNAYYDLATVFYEWGWGTSFHFASRYAHESFAESIRRHEYYLASKLQVIGNVTTRGSSGNDDAGNDHDASSGLSSSNFHILDVGCGIGGPMRNIARFTQCQVTGLTLNPYQVQRGNDLCAADDTVKHLCRSVQGDFMAMPFAGQTFDAAYAIEATCHAPDRVKVYRQIYQVLKPGSIFACYEWCMTDMYDPTNPEHVDVKHQIQVGDGLPDIASTSDCVQAMKDAGFEVLETRDLVDDERCLGLASGSTTVTPNGNKHKTTNTTNNNSAVVKPWMLPLLPSWNIFTQRFQFSWLGSRVTNVAIVALETLGLAPRGTIKTQRMLQEGAFGLAKGGTLGIFTPMFLMVGRVPMSSTSTSTATSSVSQQEENVIVQQ